MRFVFVLLLHVIILPGVSIAGSIYESPVTRISDGDTFSIRYQENIFKIRVFGIDCPEMGQTYGEEAKAFVQRILPIGRAIKWEYLYTDRFKRAVAIVYLSDGSTLQEALIQEGLAWVYERYCDRPICEDWRSMESQARAKGVGLWLRADSIPPWEWRKSKHGQR